MHPTKQSVHYQGMGWAKKNQQPQNPQSPNPNPNPNQRQQPNQYSSTYQPQAQNPLMQQNNSPFPTNNNANNRPRNFTNQNNYGPQQMQQMPNGSVRRLNNMNPQQMRMQQQQMRGPMTQSMTAQQMRNSMNPNMQQQAQIRMANNMQNRNNNMQNPQMRKSMPPQQMNPQQMNKMNPQQMNKMNPQQMKMNPQQMKMNPQQMNKMNPQQMNKMNGSQPQHRKDNKTQIFGQDPSVPAPPGANKSNDPKSPKSPDDDNEDIYGKYSKSGPNQQKNQRPATGNTLQPNRSGHFQSNSANNVGQNPRQNVHFKNTASTGSMQSGPKHRKDNKTKIFGQDPSVPAPPGANNNKNKPPQQPGAPGPGNNRVTITNNPNVKPGQLTPQQVQQMNNMQKQNQTYRQQQMLRNQNQSVRNVHGHQRQVRRNFGGTAWGPSHPYYRQWQMQRQMQMQRMNPQMQKQNQYYRQWQQYYQRMMQNPQGQLQQMIMQQQQMIANLKRQLQERDKHYHKTIQTTINFKDMEINELRGQITKLEDENEAIGELQVQNFQMKKELNNLRGDHQANVFDNLFSKISGSVKGSKVQWPGGKPPAGAGNKNKQMASPPTSSTIEAGGKDPKAALNAMLKAKASPSEMLLTKKEEEKKKDSKDDGKYAKYAKMKKIGMPMVSIVNKMRMDGLSAQEIEEYTGESVGGGASKPKAAGPTVNLLDSKFDKYKRMQKLRMPIKSILNKMKLDGFPQHEIDAFSGKKSTGQTAADKKKARLDELRQLAQTMGLNPINESLPSKVAKMKRIHWEIIELSAIRKTFWWNINQDGKIPEHIDLGGKFELDFQVRARKPRLNMGKGKIMGGLDAITGNKGKKKGKGDQIRWVSAKRDQSIQIALKRVGLPNEVIYDAIVDVNEDVMTLDLLDVIWEIVPDSDEQAIAESKVDEIGDDMDNVGISEMFHIEMSTIPEVKQQLSKWLFARTFREIYMDRLAQVNVMQRCATTIKHSIALQTYFRIILSVGNLMNHGTVKGMAYGYKLDSVNKLLRGIKDYGGKKDLGMWLYQFAYNKFPETRSIFEELEQELKKAKRLEVTTIESSIVKMADEFTAIDLFTRRLHDDFHPGDTEKFREYMSGFQERQSSDMMNLKVKIQNASSVCKQVAKFYSIELEEGKPEHLFIVIQQFVELLYSSKRSLLKLEKERVKAEQKAAREAAKKRKKENKNSDLSKMSISDRIAQKKKKAIEDEEKGNLLFLDIKNAANNFANRQAQMALKLESTLKEKQQLAKGKVSASAQKDAIKRRVSAQVVDGDNSVGGLDMEEIKRLRAMNLGPGNPNQQPMGNSLMVPGMEMDSQPINDNDNDNNNNMNDMNNNMNDMNNNMNNNMNDMNDINENQPMDQNDYGSLQAPQMDMNNNQQTNQQMQDVIEDMNQDIDVQQPGAQWDDDDF